MLAVDMKGPIGGVVSVVAGMFLLWKSISVRRMAAEFLADRDDPTGFWRWGAAAHVFIGALGVLMIVGGVVTFFVRLVA